MSCTSIVARVGWQSPSRTLCAPLVHRPAMRYGARFPLVSTHHPRTYARTSRMQHIIYQMITHLFNLVNECINTCKSTTTLNMPVSRCGSLSCCYRSLLCGISCRYRIEPRTNHKNKDHMYLSLVTQEDPQKRIYMPCAAFRRLSLTSSRIF